MNKTTAISLTLILCSMTSLSMAEILQAKLHGKWMSFKETDAFTKNSSCHIAARDFDDNQFTNDLLVIAVNKKIINDSGELVDALAIYTDGLLGSKIIAATDDIQILIDGKSTLIGTVDFVTKAKAGSKMTFRIKVGNKTTTEITSLTGFTDAWHRAKSLCK